jgi:hypothetical protein
MTRLLDFGDMDPASARPASAKVACLWRAYSRYEVLEDERSTLPVPVLVTVAQDSWGAAEDVPLNRLQGGGGGCAAVPRRLRPHRQ